MLMMIDKDGFDETAFDNEINLIKDVSILLMLNKKSIDEANDVGEANLIWWSRTCSCNLILLANLTEQRRHAKVSRRTASSAYIRAFFFSLSLHEVLERLSFHSEMSYKLLLL